MTSAFSSLNEWCILTKRIGGPVIRANCAISSSPLVNKFYEKAPNRSIMSKTILRVYSIFSSRKIPILHPIPTPNKSLSLYESLETLHNTYQFIASSTICNRFNAIYAILYAAVLMAFLSVQLSLLCANSVGALTYTMSLVWQMVYKSITRWFLFLICLTGQ